MSEVVAEAVHHSRCPWCDGDIFEGDRIAPLDDGDWVHEDCAREAEK